MKILFPGVVNLLHFLIVFVDLFETSRVPLRKGKQGHRILSNETSHGFNSLRCERWRFRTKRNK